MAKSIRNPAFPVKGGEIMGYPQIHGEIVSKWTMGDEIVALWDEGYEVFQIALMLDTSAEIVRSAL